MIRWWLKVLVNTFFILYSFSLTQLFRIVYILHVVRVLNVDKRTIQIPKGRCSVEGDNAPLSQDSIYYRPVSTLSTYRLSQDSRYYGHVSTLSTYRLSQDGRYYGPVSTLSTYKLSQDNRYYGPISTLTRSLQKILQTGKYTANLCILWLLKIYWLLNWLNPGYSSSLIKNCLSYDDIFCWWTATDLDICLVLLIPVCKPYSYTLVLSSFSRRPVDCFVFCMIICLFWNKIIVNFAYR